MSIREITPADLALSLERGAAVIEAALLVVDKPVGKSVSVYIVCQSGGRSMRACEFLHDAGVTNVINVAGGTMGFAALGHLLTVGDQA